MYGLPIHSLVPRSSPRPVFDHLQLNWTVGNPGVNDTGNGSKKSFKSKVEGVNGYASLSVK